MKSLLNIIIFLSISIGATYIYDRINKSKIIEDYLVHVNTFNYYEANKFLEKPIKNKLKDMDLDTVEVLKKISKRYRMKITGYSIVNLDSRVVTVKEYNPDYRKIINIFVQLEIKNQMQTQDPEFNKNKNLRLNLFVDELLKTEMRDFIIEEESDYELVHNGEKWVVRLDL